RRRTAVGIVPRFAYRKVMHGDEVAVAVVVVLDLRTIRADQPFHSAAVVVDETHDVAGRAGNAAVAKEERRAPGHDLLGDTPGCVELVDRPVGSGERI